ncbi:uncharacterized protein NEMAJ01_1542, partial [Nematocida major]|uniref:uncharacterized protein n=1 Tax=Nematocida major TaxID=1912982 RepID=UPI0020077488
MHKKNAWIQSRLLHISHALEEDARNGLEKSNIYLYSPTRHPLIKKQTPSEEYSIGKLVKNILTAKQRRAYEKQKNSPCTHRMCSQKWKDVHLAVGTEGIHALFRDYTVLERVDGAYIKYFSDEIQIIEREKHRRARKIAKQDRDFEMKEVTQERIYAGKHAEYADEIALLLRNIRKVGTRGIVASFEREKAKKARKEEKTGISACEVSVETAVRLVYAVVKKVFSPVIPPAGMPRIKKKIRWFLACKNAVIRYADIHAGIRTNFPQRVRNGRPLEYKEYILCTVNFIFTRYIPYLLGAHLKDNGKTGSEVRYFFAGEYARMKKEFIQKYIEKYFVSVQKAEVNTNDISHINAIAKKNAFRVVFKKAYENDVFSLAKNKDTFHEKRICSILTREANERAEWERSREGRPPRTRVNNSVFKLSDGMKRIEQFRTEFREFFESRRELFVLTLDLENFFDNVSLEAVKRMSLVRKLMGKREYEVFIWEDTSFEGHKVHRRAVLYPNEQTNKGDTILTGLPKRVFRKFMSQNIITNTEIEELLNRRIHNSVIRYGSAYYRRVTGINQGCRFASHICSYYLAHIDEEIYGDMKYTRAVRYVDDSLVLSWSKEELALVLERLCAMQGRNGLALNAKKCQLLTLKKETDFSLLGKIDLKRAKTFKWCGISFDMESLYPAMQWSEAKTADLVQSKSAILRRMHYSLNLGRESGLFHPENLSRHTNLRLFVRCHVEKLLHACSKTPNQHMEKTLLRILRRKICTALASTGLPETDIKKAFNAAVYICKKK